MSDNVMLRVLFDRRKRNSGVKDGRILFQYVAISHSSYSLLQETDWGRIGKIPSDGKASMLVDSTAVGRID